MRSKLQTSGGKLVSFAILTLLLCIVLFAIASWGALTYMSEHTARSNARGHLFSIKQAYTKDQTALVDQLSQITHDPRLGASFAQAGHSGSTNGQLPQTNDQLTSLLAQYGIDQITLISPQRQIVAQAQTAQAIGLPLENEELLARSLNGQTAFTLEASTQKQSPPFWSRRFAFPIYNTQGEQIGVMMASQVVDNQLSLSLAETARVQVFLCVKGQIVSSTQPAILNAPPQICGAGTPQRILQDQPFLALAEPITVQGEVTGSPTLMVGTLEPLYTFAGNISNSLWILLAISIFVLALGAALYTQFVRVLLIRPLALLQHQTSKIAYATTGQELQPQAEEVRTVIQAFQAMLEALYLQDKESQEITQQLGKLLIMNDTLISTLNVDDLLGKVVSQIGKIMHACHVSLQLFGRDMEIPWAVAQWSPEQRTSEISKSSIVDVHIDPEGDITMAATSKLAALPNHRSNGKRQPSQQSPGPTPNESARPKIPRTALRELDLLLANKAMQKHKIAYVEDIAATSEYRREKWIQLALNEGYQSAIAVPLSLQNQAIGAFMIYRDYPYQMTDRDQFLLSTAAIQTTMALQNSLFFSEVKEKNAELERVNNLKSQFLATVTHELRTPLHSIISYGGLILEGFVDGELTQEQHDHLQLMVDRAEDLSHLVNDMLDLSKIEADHLEVKVEPLTLEKSLSDVISQLKPLADTKGLSLYLETEQHLPQVLADGHRIRQIVLNMVSNALKFTEKGEVRISCAFLKNYDLVRVSVHDTGIGISPAALDYIFEAFRQADGSTTRQFGGTGLGLTIARKLIELQGGEVAVESTVGQGSTFSFTLPVVPAPARI